MITQAQLKEVLEYQPETGIFVWAKDRGKVKAGDVAGNLSAGYVQIMVDFKPYLAHRLAWLYVYGKFPKSTIDHINQDRADNRIGNLREATVQQNRWNSPGKTDGLSQWKGVTFDKGRKKCWKMSFKIPGGKVVQKRFENEREAAEEWMFLSIEHHDEFASF